MYVCSSWVLVTTQSLASLKLSLANGAVLGPKACPGQSGYVLMYSSPGFPSVEVTWLMEATLDPFYRDLKFLYAARPGVAL